MTSPTQALIDLVSKSTSKWAKQRKAEERHESARYRRLEAMCGDRSISIVDAAYRCLDQAYAKASDNGTLPANPRQIYYAARPKILEITGKKSLDDQYFCQKIMTEFIEANSRDWDIAWDDRGHFHEPHTHKRIGLGTLAVRDYLNKTTNICCSELELKATITTKGPEGRFGAILYIEKEGFLPLIEKAQIAEKFDLAIMSSKGMSVTAARRLIDELVGKYGVKVFVLHDFDITGFTIAKTLVTSAQRYRFTNKINLIDLGLRLSDVEELCLDSEEVRLKQGEGTNLAYNGATKDEIKFLLSGKRVELNAMTSSQFVKFLEGKLQKHDVVKVTPNAEGLQNAYNLICKYDLANQHLKPILESFTNKTFDIPADLENKLLTYLSENPGDPWDKALKSIVRNSNIKMMP